VSSSNGPTVHAGVVTRLLASAVDAVVVVLLVVAVDLAVAGARFLWSPTDFRWPRPDVLSGAVVLMVVAVLYLAVAWATTGRTYGGRLVGVRVVSRRHELLGWTRSVLRALACVLWPVGLLWSAVSTSRRSLQDIVLGTVVVYDVRPFVSAPGAGRPDAADRAT
jgi:uncharacterized RDD family membrane protein YckC